MEDLETIVREIAETHRLVHVVEKKGDENIKEVRKALIEYEAFVNSAVMNEKAAWLAITKQLAVDVDEVSKDANTWFSQQRMVMETQHAELWSKIDDLDNEFHTEHTNLLYDYKEFVSKTEQNHWDIAIKQAMESIKSTLDSDTIFTNIQDLYNAMQGGSRSVAPTPISGQGDNKNAEDIEEMVDGKMQQVYERLRNDNWYIWKESLKLAE